RWTRNSRSGTRKVKHLVRPSNRITNLYRITNSFSQATCRRNAPVGWRGTPSQGCPEALETVVWAEILFATDQHNAASPQPHQGRRRRCSHGPVGRLLGVKALLSLDRPPAGGLFIV